MNLNGGNDRTCYGLQLICIYNTYRCIVLTNNKYRRSRTKSSCLIGPYRSYSVPVHLPLDPELTKIRFYKQFVQAVGSTTSVS